jgi:aspartyl-tRNA(Asn)/glutamyl-tRNA(Gln) amidotransferase subunit A
MPPISHTPPAPSIHTQVALRNPTAAKRVGVANNLRGDREVLDAFERAVQTIRGLGYPVSSVAVAFGNPSGDLSNIEADRKAIASQTFKNIDVLLLPSLTTTAPTIKDAAADPQTLLPENTLFGNYYGLPAISVPCGFDRNGLPLGLQIVGKPWGEATVLHLAYRYETTTPWKTKHPNV